LPLTCAAPHSPPLVPAGWVHSPADCEERVFEHRVAGDLIMPAATIRAVNNVSGMSSPTKEALRRRTMLRPSGGSGVPPSPGKGTTAGGGGGGPGGRISSPVKKPTPPARAGSTDDGKASAQLGASHMRPEHFRAHHQHTLALTAPGSSWPALLRRPAASVETSRPRHAFPHPLLLDELPALRRKTTWSR
jgi:hypothetical protein